MIIKTDSSHKKVETKQLLSNINGKAKRIVKKIGPFVVIAGMLVTMSGCSVTNRIYAHFNDKDNEEIIRMYEEGELANSGKEKLTLSYVPMDEDFIDNLPSDLRYLNLHGDQYLTDLTNLPFVCPNLEELRITQCYGVTNFDFIKDFPNLKEFIITGETIGVTPELIDYLNSRGITHNLNNELVELDKAVEDIVKSIITDEMSEDDKMDAIANYVINNMKYDKSALINNSEASNYNEKAISLALKGKGICANYAAFTSVLCSKAGITSYYVTDSNHAWNLVKLDEKYYYVDTTNISQVPIISKLLMKKFGVGFFYKQDPYHTTFSAMSDIDNVMMPHAPQRLLQLIDEAQDEKSFIEKYGSNAVADLIAIAGITIGLSACVKAAKTAKRGY